MRVPGEIVQAPLVELPPAQPPKAQKRGFFGKVKGFFAAMFR